MPEFLSDIPASFPPSAIVTGSFDGLHRGHRFLINRLIETARKKNLQAVVFSFEPHPVQILNPHKAPPLLTTSEERKKIFSGIPVDKVIFYPFSNKFAKLTGKDFLSFLKKHYNLRHLVIGYDHSFGSDRLANPDDIRQTSAQMNISVSFVPPKQDEEGEIISSSRIRKLINEKKITQANSLLGYDYMISGKVIHGSKFGRQIGFPTANLSITNKHKLIPPSGVYFVQVDIGDKTYPGVMNIGKKPTFNTQNRHILPEVHLLRFQGDLYDKNIFVRLKKFHRPEKKFDNVNRLQKQIAMDAEEAKKYFQKQK